MSRFYLPQTQHRHNATKATPTLQKPPTNLPDVMNTESNIINTNTKRSKANATRGKRAAASNAAAAGSAAATVAALCVQLYYYCCLSDALMWSACGAYLYLHGAPKKCRCPCVGMRVSFVQRTTASQSSPSICASAIQDIGTIGRELPFIATYVQRVPVVPGDSTGTI